MMRRLKEISVEGAGSVKWAASQQRVAPPITVAAGIIRRSVPSRIPLPK
jgi:hypothetical protein